MNKKLFYSLLILITVLVYGPSLQYGFSQDDWYFLLISQADRLVDVFNFFNPNAQSGFPFYRPLGTQLYYYLFVRLFSFEYAPFFMHLFMLIIQSCSAVLVYHLLRLLKYKPLTSQLTALAYAGASSLFLSLFYIAATQQLLATFFSMIALTLTLRHKNLLAGLAFALALLSKESAIMTPVIMLLLLYFWVGVKKFSDLIKSSLPYAIVGLVYIALRLSAPLVIQSDYHFAFGTNVVSTLRWFFLFGYGAPEEYLRYATVGGGVDLLSFVRDHGFWGGLNVLTVGILTLLSVITIIRNLRSSRIWLYLSWFTLGLLPILFLQNHRYPHYLDLALIPLLLLLLDVFAKAPKLITTLLLISSFSSVVLSSTTHWTIARAQISDRAIAYFQKNQLCEDEQIQFVAPAPYPAELGHALSLANGPRVICNNPDLEVEYISSNQADPAVTHDPRMILLEP